MCGLEYVFDWTDNAIHLSFHSLAYTDLGTSLFWTDYATHLSINRLACADLSMCLFGLIMPFIGSYHHKWPFGRIGCAIHGFSHYAVGNEPDCAVYALYSLLSIHGVAFAL